MLDLSNLYATRAELYNAIKENNLAKLSKMLMANKQNYINLNFIDKDGQSPLHRSCIIGNLDMVKMLVKFGANYNLANRDGWYPIHIASYFGFAHIVMYLIETAEEDFAQSECNSTICSINNQLNENTSDGMQTDEETESNSSE